MDDFQAYYRKMLQLLIYALALGVVLWGAVPAWRPIFAGFILGDAASIGNMIFLAKKVDKIAQMAAAQIKRRSQSGFFTRLSVALMILLIATHYPQEFNIYSTLIGLFFFQVLILSKGLITAIKHIKL